MTISDLSIKQPVLISCIVIAVAAVGVACFSALGVELFPEVSIPVVSVTTQYPGAGPSEIETLVSKPIEDEVSSISGMKRLSSKNLEGVSIVIAEFRNGVDVQYAEQQVRDKVSIAKAKLPTDSKEPLIKKFDPSDQPIMTIAIGTKTKISDGVLFDIADQFVKTRLEQVNNVGTIEIIGGRKREIHVTLDRAKLKDREISVVQVAARVGASGENVPSGKVDVGHTESVFRSVGEFKKVDEIKDTLVSLYGNEVSTRISDIGKVEDTLEDEKTRASLNGEKSLFIDIYRQSGSNTVDVADGVKLAIKKMTAELQQQPGAPAISVVRDASETIKYNVDDVYETIVIGIILTVITVYFFLASFRATLITSLSLPISLIGTFTMMYLAHFSINIISLLAMTLAIGLLIDDAIVIIENIYRRIELGEKPSVAASLGTREIQLSVVAITLVVISIFAPVGFMTGVVGQFLKQFGLTIAFSMMVSFAVAMTVIPMLSAYFAGSQPHGEHKKLPPGLKQFDQFQTWLEKIYRVILTYTVAHPLTVLAVTMVVFVACMFSATLVPGSFLPDNDNGQIMVNLDLPTGTNLDGTGEIGTKIEQMMQKEPSVKLVSLTVGNINGESNKGQLYVELKKGKFRTETTNQFKEKIRKELSAFPQANPIVADYDPGGGNDNSPVTIDLIATDQAQLDKYAQDFVAFLKKDPRLKDVDSTSRPGRPEFQVNLKPGAAHTYGINTRSMGEELRAQVEGETPAKFREKGYEYDVRVRLLPEQRNIEKDFMKVMIPNVNQKLVPLSYVASGDKALGAASINRQNRGRYVRVTANTAPGVGTTDVLNAAVKYLTVDQKMPEGMRYGFAGQTENMEEMQGSFMATVGFGVLFIYLILSSLYGSFVTPITILIAFPLALCGAFLALFVMHETFSIFAILGVFLLLGVAGKNSILLIDFARQRINEGVSRSEALIEAGTTRLRPILMTSFALIAGTLPVAIGLNEASKQRTGMGVAIIGGLISSTLLTLIVVPAVFSYVDRYRIWSKTLLARLFKVESQANEQEDHGIWEGQPRTANDDQPVTADGRSTHAHVSK